MKKLLPCCLILLSAAFLLASAPQAKEEFAPGFDLCMKTAGKSLAMRADCWEKASAYWNEEVNVAYRDAIANCSNTNTPNDCQSHIKKAQNAWIEYREAMKAYLSLEEKQTDKTSMKKNRLLTTAAKRHAQMLNTK